MNDTCWPRPCSVRVGAASYRGMCWGLGIKPDSARPFALIEGEGGDVRVVWLDGAQAVRMEDGQ